MYQQVDNTMLPILKIPIKNNSIKGTRKRWDVDAIYKEDDLTCSLNIPNAFQISRFRDQCYFDSGYLLRVRPAL